MQAQKHNVLPLICLSIALFSAGCLGPDIAEINREHEQRMTELKQKVHNESIERRSRMVEKVQRDHMAAEDRKQEQKMAERDARKKNAERSRAWKSEDKSVPLSDSVSIELKSIPGPLWVGKFEVTQAQWETVMGTNPSLNKGADLPVERISWKDCQFFLKKLNALPGVKKSGIVFRLPTEEEWCLARYAGATGKYGTFANGAEISKDDLGKVAWLKETSEDETHPVGQKEPNAFGLYDMLGNVEELTSTTEKGYDGKESRVIRGGCFENLSAGLLDFDRTTLPDVLGVQHNTIGFRLVATDAAK